MRENVRALVPVLVPVPGPVRVGVSVCAGVLAEQWWGVMEELWADAGSNGGQQLGVVVWRRWWGVVLGAGACESGKAMAMGQQ